MLEKPICSKAAVSELDIVQRNSLRDRVLAQA